MEKEASLVFDSSSRKMGVPGILKKATEPVLYPQAVMAVLERGDKKASPRGRYSPYLVVKGQMALPGLLIWLI